MQIQQIIIPLTETERDFAEKNHYLILNFLERNGLSMDEYYDVLIFRYLRAVKKHFEDKERKTDFITAVNKALGLALRDCLKKQYRQEQYERAASLDAQVSDGYTLLDLIGNGERDACEECLDRMAEKRIAESLPYRLQRMLYMLVEGYSSREITRTLGVPVRQIGSLKSEMRMLVSLFDT